MLGLRRKPKLLLSFIVIAYDMAREIPRTLDSLDRHYQRSGDSINYEVIVVDNGSPQPLDAAALTAGRPHCRVIRVEDASPSPAAAINLGVGMAKGKFLGIVIDGARMLSPGVVHWGSRALQLGPRTVVSVPGFHLGPDHQRESSQRGYSKTAEDALLAAIDWPQRGYRLFEIASLAGSSRFGWTAPLAESNCLLLSRALFDEVGGYDTAFASAGGGLVNLDFYRRVCDRPELQLVHLFGEGCFHQMHGGVTTGGGERGVSRYPELMAEYEAIRGQPHRVPQLKPLLFGEVQPEAHWLVAHGASQLRDQVDADSQRQQLFALAGLPESAPTSGAGDNAGKS